MESVKYQQLMKQKSTLMSMELITLLQSQQKCSGEGFREKTTVLLSEINTHLIDLIQITA